MVSIKKWESVQLSKVAYMSSFVVNKSHELILQIKNKNLALDATLGNGHDSLFLASLFNKVIGIDIQPLAIKRSKERLKNESALVSVKRWMNKNMLCIYTYAHNGTPLWKKNKILAFATTWMDLEGIMLSEISQRKTNAVWKIKK